LIAELRDVAGRPFFRSRLRASVAELLAAGLRDFSLFCRDLPSSPIAPDPKDSYLLSLAEASQADFLVTGDKELLSLKQHKSTRMITPAAVIELLQETERGKQRKDE
jgi:putative PIN family toxin of toxin-antitoxin system